MRAQHVLSVHDLGLHERHAFGAVQDAAIGFKQTLGRIKKGAFKLNGDHPGAALHAPGCIGHAHIHEGHQGPTVSDMKGVHVRIQGLVGKHRVTVFGAHKFKTQKVGKGDVDAKVLDKGVVPLLIRLRVSSGHYGGYGRFGR